jgi:hypothetical protein
MEWVLAKCGGAAVPENSLSPNSLVLFIIRVTSTKIPDPCVAALECMEWVLAKCGSAAVPENSLSQTGLAEGVIAFVLAIQVEVIFMSSFACRCLFIHGWAAKTFFTPTSTG